MTPLPLAGEYVLQFGIPGGPELLVIFLMLVMMALPVALVVIIVVIILRLRNSGGGDDRVEELERRVDRLQSELEAERGGDDERAPATDRDAERE